MASRLAELAKTEKLKGAVQVSFACGASKTYDDEAAACAALEGVKSVEHRRGAFFADVPLKGLGASKAKPVAKNAPEPEAKPKPSKSSSKSSGNRRRSD